MTQRVYNFSPGPATLPLAVLERIREDIVEWGDRGVSVIEVSHRSKPYIALADSLRERIRRLLSVPETHEILFCAGGAASQFAAIPLNLASEQAGAHVVSGHWSRKAFKQASQFTDAVLVTDNESHEGVSIDPVSHWNLPEKAAYLYYTDNETVNGFLLPSLPDVSYPIVCDMTSSMFMDHIDFSKHAMVMASAQKNIGAAGMTVLIIHRDLCERQAMIQTPYTLSYAELLKTDSMPNTPCTFSWYVCDLMCEWMEEQGGVDVMKQWRDERAKALYDVIDNDPMFMSKVDLAYRSPVNVVFELHDEGIQNMFLAEAKKAGFHALKGHRAVGGCRASMYNGMPVEAAHALAEFMRDFSKRHG